LTIIFVVMARFMRAIHNPAAHIRFRRGIGTVWMARTSRAMTKKEAV
jgi:hypothetical protein